MSVTKATTATQRVMVIDDCNLAEALDGMADGFCLLDRQWRFIFVNRGLEVLTLIDRDNALGRTIWEVCPFILHTALDAALRRVMDERVRAELEFASVSRPDAICAVSIFPVEAGLGLTYRDVTEQSDARRHERRHAERLELALAASGMGDFSLDMDNGIVTCSERAAAIMGCPAEISVKGVLAWANPDDAERIRTAAQFALRQGTAFELEHKVRRPDGTEIWVAAWARPQYDHSGRPVSINGVLADITGSKAKEAKIRESEARFRSFAEGVPASMWVVGVDGSIEFVNRAGMDFSGLDAATCAEPKALRAAVDARIHPEDRARVTGADVEAATLHVPFEIETRHLNARNEWRWLRIISQPRHDEDGLLLGYIGLAIDITDIREAQARQQRLIDELNHRVKNTLATVQSIASQTLRDGCDLGVAKQTFIDRILALSAAHDVLTREHWQGVDLRAIATLAARLRDGDSDPRIEIEGPPARLSSNVAVGLAIGLHELAANAARHGALSVPEGRVSLTWRPAPGAAAMQLTWCERGGPPVEAPRQTGFGTNMLTRGLAADLAYCREGLICTICVSITEEASPLPVGGAQAD